MGILSAHLQSIKVRLHLPYPAFCPSPSKFNIVPIVKDRLTDRFGSESILSFSVNFGGDRDGDGMCKWTLRKTMTLTVRVTRP